MPIYPIKTRLYEEPIEPELLLFVDFRYTNCYNGGTTITNLANGNTLNVGDGTIVGSPVFSPEEGGSFYFGPGSGIDFSTNSLQVSNRDYLTITAYVKFGVASGFLGSSFFANSGSTSSPFGAGGDSHAFGAIIGNRFTFGNLATVATYSLNEWYHVTWTKEPTGGASTESHLYRFYLNGELKETYVTRNNGTTSTNISVGYDKGIGSRFLGTIAQVKVWTSDASPLNTFRIVSESSSARFRPYTIGTKKTPSDIILYLAEKGSRTGWGDNSMYSNGAILLGGAQFNSGLILPGTNPFSNYAQGTLTVEPGQNFTISAWVQCYGNSSASSTLQTIFATGLVGPLFMGGNANPSLGIIFGLVDSDRTIAFLSDNNGNTFKKSAVNIFQFNETFHAAVKVSSSGGVRTISIYKNGVLSTTSTIPTGSYNWTNKGYRLGDWVLGYEHPFNGKIFNVTIHNRTLSDDEIKDIYSAMPSSYKSNESTYNQEPQANKILYLDAAEPKSYYLTGATVRDLSSNNRNGTLTSDSGSLPTFSKFFAGHFQFKGLSTKSFISLAAATLPSGLAPYTVIFWMRPNNISKTQVLFMYGNESTNNLCRGVSIYLGRIYSFQDRIPANQLDSQISIEVGKWYQVAHTYTGSIESIYVNGILANSRGPRSFNTNVNSPADFRIGAGFFKNPPTSGSIIDFYFDGDIGEFTMYDRALDPQEVYQDYFIKKNRYKALDVTRPSGSGAPTVPVVQTAIVTSITTTSAESGGAVLSIGGRALSARGIIWSTTIDPTLPSNYLGIDTDALTVQGSFTSTIGGLSSGQTYYVRAYATNQIGTGYGQSVEFVATATVIPGVIAVTASSATSTTVGVTSSITSLGNAPSVSARGVIWSTTTINPSTVNLSTYTNKLIETGTYNTGEFFQTISGLSADTVYYLRSVASNGAGNKISDNEITVRTKVADALPTVSITIVDTFNDITGTSVTAEVTTTGTNLELQGIVWSTSGTNPNIVTMPDKSLAPNNPNGSTFVISTNVDALSIGTEYYFWGYVKKVGSLVTVYSTPILITTDNVPTLTSVSFINTGSFTGRLDLLNGSTVTEIGIIWTDGLDPIATYTETNLSGFAQGYTFTASPQVNFLVGIDYYAYAYGVNSVGTGESSPLSVMIINKPTVTTLAASGTGLTRTLNGTLNNLGGSASAVVGFYFGTVNPPTAKFPVNTLTSPGSFNTTTSTLVEGQTYYFQAYASNSSGESQSSVLSFLVASLVPTISTTYSNDIILAGSSLIMELTANGITNNPTTRGFVWGSAINPTDALTAKTSKGTGNTGFTSSIPTDSPGNLAIAPDTDTYVRAYARNISGIGYSENLRIYSANIGLTLAIDTNKLVYSGTITSLTSNKVVAQGVVYSTSPITPAVLRSGSGYTLVQATQTTNATNWAFPNTDGTLTAADSNTIYYARTYVKLNSTYGGHFVYSRERSTTILPVISSTITTSNLLGTSVTVQGTVTTNGGGTLTAVGICYATTGSPTIANFTKAAASNATGTFTVNITGLSLNTLYYLRVYATNESGTNYSPAPGATITTTNVSTLTTAAITVFGGTTATLGGTITSDGNSTITERGVVYATTQSPTTANNKLVGSATPTFTVNATGLVLGTLYYVRAYAINANGTSYGNQQSFTTTTIPTISSTAITALTNTTATSGGNITSDGGSAVTARGVVWSTAQNPTVALTTKTSDSTGTGVFTSNITGLTQNTTYYVRAYATNANGTAYGNQLTLSTFAITTGTVENIFSNKVGVTASNIVWDTPPITARGVVWSTSPSPTIANSKTTDGSGTGTFNSPNVQILSASTLYYIRAYATNANGTFYGNQIQFTTPAHPNIITSVLYSIVRGANQPGTTFPNYSLGTTTAQGSYQEFKISTSIGLSNLWYPGFVISTSANTPVTLEINDVNTINQPVSPITRLPYFARYDSTGTDIYAGPLVTTATRPWYVRTYLTDGVNVIYSSTIRTIHMPQLPLFTPTSNVDGTITVTITLNSMQPGSSPAPVVNKYGYVIIDVNNTVTHIEETSPILSNQYSRTIDTNNPDVQPFIASGTAYKVNAWVEYTHPDDGTIRIYSQTANGTKLAVTQPWIRINASPAATVTSDSITNISLTITYDGGASVTQRGVCWVQGTGTPTISNNPVSSGTGTGTFTVNITGLSGLTQYTVRAYATNTAGTKYSNVVTYTTTVSLTTIIINPSFDLRWDIPSNPTILIGSVAGYMDPAAQRLNPTDTQSRGFDIYDDTGSSVNSWGLGSGASPYAAQPTFTNWRVSVGIPVGTNVNPSVTFPIAKNQVTHGSFYNNFYGGFGNSTYVDFSFRQSGLTNYSNQATTLAKIRIPTLRFNFTSLTDTGSTLRATFRMVDQPPPGMTIIRMGVFWRKQATNDSTVWTTREGNSISKTDGVINLTSNQEVNFADTSTSATWVVRAFYSILTGPGNSTEQFVMSGHRIFTK